MRIEPSGLPGITKVAALLGDRARGEMMNALMWGRAFTATELANVADVTKATASAHLAKLRQAGLITSEAHGRHRYFMIANEHVAQALENLMVVAAEADDVARSGPRDPALRKARVCYNHLAGEIAIGLYDRLRRSGAFEATNTNALELTARGHEIMQAFGVDSNALARVRGVACSTCMDWSERRHHLAGAVGRALLERLIALGWVTRDHRSRLVRVRPHAERMLRNLFAVTESSRRAARS